MGRSPPPPCSAALVLAGGAARGAYEVGVLEHLVKRVAPAIGRALPFDILSGTSVGAVHACALAAIADAPITAVARMEKMWCELRLGDLVRIDPREVLGAVRGLLGHAPRGARRGGILHPEPVERWLSEAVPFERIGRNLGEGFLQAVTVSATHVASGRTVVFLDRAPGRSLPPWSRDPTTELRPTCLRREHAMASAAVPLLLPAVTIDGELYCDGGLRQLVPFSPAIHLGARALLAVSPRALPRAEPFAKEQARERAYASPTYLAGKAIDALLLDRIDEDVHHLDQMNAVLRAGERRWGDGFAADLNAALGASHHALHPVRAAVIRASADIGELAASFVRSRRFRHRTDGASQRLLRWMADAEESRETDLLSYLLFDGGFAAELIALGRADAAARHAELCALLADEPRQAGAFA